MVLSMGKCLMCRKNSLCEKTLRAQGVCLFGEFMCRGKGAVRADVPPRFCASKIFRSPTPHPHKPPPTSPTPPPSYLSRSTPSEIIESHTHVDISPSFNILFPKGQTRVTLMIESLHDILLLPLLLLGTHE